MPRRIRARAHRGQQLRALPLPLLEMDQQQRNRGGSHSRDAGSLAQVRRPDALELLTDLIRKPAHGSVIEIRGQRRLGLAPLPLDLAALPLDVAGIAGFDLERLLDLLATLGLAGLDLVARADSRQRYEVPVADFRSLQQLDRPHVAAEGRGGMPVRNVCDAHDGRAEATRLALEAVAFDLEIAPLFI